MIASKLEEWSRWDRLRKFGASPLVRSSLVFAVAGYLLLWNGKIQDYLIIRFDAHYSLWRIWMIYYGGILIAAATGLYSVFCPKPIKDYQTAFELAQSECQYLATMGLGAKYLESVQRLEVKCDKREKKLFPTDRPRDNLIPQVQGTVREAHVLAALIVYAWRLHNIRYTRMRPTILVIFAAGFLLVGIPATATFLQVTLVGLRALF